MDTIREKIEELTRRINELARSQTTISNQLIQLINELDILKQQAATATTPIAPQEKEKTPEKIIEYKEVIEAPVQKPVQQPIQPPAYQKTAIPKSAPATAPKRPSPGGTSLEEIIGKNIASKVGILITIIGVFIGAKYAIDNDLVSPTVRIIAGYISGLLLIGIALRLKNKYIGYSSVLIGGGLAVLYFITYVAYGFYALLPQTVAFIIMLVITIGTVYAALVYNYVIIAHLGMVGAYAIPFLLSNNSGRYAILFSYIAIINTGILVLSFKKNWKSLFYAAFGLTWIIYTAWFAWQYRDTLHFNMALLFLGIYFISFYATFLAYKLVRKEQYDIGDVMVLLSNSFIFFGFGYGILKDHEGTENWLGVFTVANAAIHLVISQVIRKMGLADKALYYLVLGWMMVFLTIAIPIQFDGNWVTLLWTAEALLLCYIGRTKGARAYDKLGAALMLLGFLSLAQDWVKYYLQLFSNDSNIQSPFANIVFITGVLISAAQAAIVYLQWGSKYQSQTQSKDLFNGFFRYFSPAVFLVTTYFVFFLEIGSYFDYLDNQLSKLPEGLRNTFDAVENISAVVLLLYTIVFCTTILFVNLRRIKKLALATVGLIGAFIVMVVFLMAFLNLLNYMAEEYSLRTKGSEYFGALNLLIRYIVFIVLGILLWFGRRSIIIFVKEKTLVNAWTLAINVCMLAIICAEYLHWAKALGANNQYKLGLTVIWGVYALLLIIYGIWKKVQFLRIAAIALFGGTLVKLFFYDLAGAGTITKTISFISLGVILLVVSYLYNRYKEKLFS
jgi:uncharacterized membrane protein